MSILQKMFGCCERDKTIKKSEIDLNHIKNDIENNIVSTKDTQRNFRYLVRNSSPLINVSLSAKNFLFKKEETDKSSATFVKTLKVPDNPIINRINIQKRIKLRPSQTINSKRDVERNEIISISDLSFISDKDEQKANFSKLLLTGDLFFGKEIIINDCGMVNSKRNKKDGYTVFGLKNCVDISGNLYNDFIVNFDRDQEEIGKIEASNGKLFEIKFNKDQKEYTLFFINPYLYLYYKINNFVYFYQNKDYFLFVGKIFLYIYIEKKGSEKFINIQVDNTCKELQKPKDMNQKYRFSEKNSIIKIGRVNCDINIGEKCISKIHGIIEFSKINHNFYYKNMSHTNGTTLLIKKGDFLKIKGEMNFRLEDVAFKIQEIP